MRQLNICKNMKHATSLIVVLCIIMLIGCSEKPDAEGKYRQYFAFEDAVDLSDVLDINKKYETAEKDSTIHYDADSALLGKDADSYSGIIVIDDTASAIQLPQYKGSKQPFLAKAEVFYNSCQFAFNIWSNYEIWVRSFDGYELADKNEIMSAIEKTRENDIHNDQIRVAAKKYKDNMLNIIKTMYGDEGAFNKVRDAFSEFTAAIEKGSYKFYTNEEQFVDSLDSMSKELRAITKATIVKYENTDSLKRLNMILHAINDCKTFDEQCSLLMNWADNELSRFDDQWIVAVAARLINSGKYNPCLNDIWIMWRCLFQQTYCGMSHDSSIPNDFYNGMRKQCYLTCLKWINGHPTDVFAMNCAAAIAGRSNLNRFGPFMFGNQGVTEEREILPDRFKKTDEETDESDKESDYTDEETDSADDESYEE